jgi:hypothetical protein
MAAETRLQPRATINKKAPPFGRAYVTVMKEKVMNFKRQGGICGSLRRVIINSSIDNGY